MNYYDLEKQAKFRDSVDTAKRMINSSIVARGIESLSNNEALGSAVAMGANALEGAAMGAAAGGAVTGGQLLYRKISNGEVTKDEVKDLLKKNMTMGGIAGGTTVLGGDIREKSAMPYTERLEKIASRSQTPLTDRLERALRNQY